MTRLVDTLPEEEARALHELMIEEVPEDVAGLPEAQRRLYFVVTAGMVRFLESDDDLALVVGHELAHVSRGHIEAQMGNQLIGALLGAVVTGATGVDMTQTGAEIGALAFSQEFEAEADYVGVYHAARAGYNVEKSAELWRRMARIHPKAINLIGSTHSSTAKRFLAIRAAAREVESKRARNKLLIPEEQ